VGDEASGGGGDLERLPVPLFQDQRFAGEAAVGIEPQSAPIAYIFILTEVSKFTNFRLR
jgi:hypothetical protein